MDMKTPQKDLDVKRDPSFPSNFPQDGITLPDEKHILGDGWHHQPSRVWLSPEPAPCQASTEALGPEGQAAVWVAKHTHTRARDRCVWVSYPHIRQHLDDKNDSKISRANGTIFLHERIMHIYIIV